MNLKRAILARVDEFHAHERGAQDARLSAPLGGNFHVDRIADHGVP